MMKGRFLVVLGTLIMALLACEKEELHTPATDNEVNQWIERTLRDHYLWYDDMPAEGAVDRGSAPEEFFLSLLSDQDGKEQAEGHHYFSTLQRAATKSITDENDSYGFDFAIGTLQDNDGTHKIALVLYVLKDSPAERAGLRRGDWIVGVNGSYGTLQDYDQLRSGGSATFQLAESVEGSATSLRLGREIAIEPSTVVEDIPILKDSIYQVGTRRVGYLMYNHFELGPDENDLDDTRYQQQLEELFARFKQAGVNEFVLDLRYNGGQRQAHGQEQRHAPAPHDGDIGGQPRPGSSVRADGKHDRLVVGVGDQHANPLPRTAERTPDRQADLRENGGRDRLQRIGAVRMDPLAHNIPHLQPGP